MDTYKSPLRKWRDAVEKTQAEAAAAAGVAPEVWQKMEQKGEASSRSFDRVAEYTKLTLDQLAEPRRRAREQKKTIAADAFASADSG